MNILEEIISYKKIEVERAKERLSLEKLQQLVRAGFKPAPTVPTGFYKAIKNQINKKEIALIAEIKKASPSKGLIRADFKPQEIAKAYKAGGATCLSVLTDEKYFHGNINYIKEIKSQIDLPILRKDFIIDPYQIHESIYNQADCILLIVAALEKDSLKRLFEIAIENEIDVLIEIHNEKEMEIALNLIGAYSNMSLLGINNRNLQTFEINLQTTINLVEKYKKDLQNKTVVSESGIFTNEDIQSLIEYGVYTFLVGESLMREDDIEGATKRLINPL